MSVAFAGLLAAREFPLVTLPRALRRAPDGPDRARRVLATAAHVLRGNATIVVRAVLPLDLPTCGKCKSLDVATAACGTCGKAYARCAAHGGTAGCLRSIHSHAALHHPRKESL